MKTRILLSLLLHTTTLTPSAVALPAGETGPAPMLQEPSGTAVRFSRVIGWPNGITPTAPEGFWVSEYARNLVSPRNLYEGPNGDVFVAEANTEIKDNGIKKWILDQVGYTRSQRTASCACRITLLRDTDQDGHPDVQSVFLEGLHQPYGMAILNGYFYVAETDGIWRYPYATGQTHIDAEQKSKREKVIDLPAGGYNNHWTRNLQLSPAKDKIYVSVGSGSNIAEHGMANEVRRANILEINPDGSGERIYASGLRNPVGMSWSSTGQLWTVVNERDGLGDALVPDYLTHLEPGGFYGWPYRYFGDHIDQRVKPSRPDLVQQSLIPDFALGAHTASLGLAFYHQKAFPARFQQGAFIGQHGSWNRSKLVGYQVAFVPFSQGQPSGELEPFLTGFIADRAQGNVYGRPVGVTVLQDGTLLVADDAGNRIWQVRALPWAPGLDSSSGVVP